jgi:hypothetical protein
MKAFLALGLCLEIIASVPSWAATSQVEADERAFFGAIERPAIKPRQKLDRWFVSAESPLWRSVLEVLSDKVASKLASADDCEMAMWVAARNEASRQSLNPSSRAVRDRGNDLGVIACLVCFQHPRKEPNSTMFDV